MCLFASCVLCSGATGAFQRDVDGEGREPLSGGPAVGWVLSCIFNTGSFISPSWGPYEVGTSFPVWQIKKKNNTKLNLRDIRYYVQENIGQKKVMSGFRSRSSKLCNLCPSIHSSVGKESSCNAGDLGSLPRLGRSPGEGIGCPLQYSWASLVAQLVKNLLTMLETWVWSLG